MVGKFIYAFDENTKNKLINDGYQLLKTSDTQSVFIFKNKSGIVFNLNEGTFVLSNTLTF